MTDELKQDLEKKVPETPEVETPEAKEVAPQPTEDEVLAMEQGWVPKDQWKGNPDDWRPAREFNERGSLFNRIKDQSKQLAELKQAMVFLTESQKNQYLAGFNEALNRLKSQRNKAIEDGDLVAAQNINDKIDDVKDQAREVKQQMQVAAQAPGPTETFKNWHTRNQWYMSDKALTRFADSEGISFKEDNPDASESEMLTHVSKAARKRFPEKFQSAPSPDSEGKKETAREASGTAATYRQAENNMTEEQRSIMRTILKTTPGMTKDQYMKLFLS